MKLPISRCVSGLAVLLIHLGIACSITPCRAQDNIWVNPGSGNWEDGPSWSLSALPGTNQTMWVTNYGWKAVQIGSGTAANFPESLNVNAINISSPTNSFNSLLLNYVGADAPLTVQTMSVGSNSAVTMNSSALQINGANGEGVTVGGQFNQNDSVVGGSQINVGYIGAGEYNFSGGYLAVSQLWVGGSYGGVFNQTGGTNAFGITHLDGGSGNYVLSNGLFGAAIYFNGGGFQQYGGLVQTNLTIFQGSYLLAGGVLEGGVTVPSGNGWTSGRGSMVQTGGTNYGSLDIGSWGGGSYTLSNGVSFAGGISVGDFGSYTQWGGTQTLSGGINVAEDQVNFEQYEGGYFTLYGGQVSSDGIGLSGYYTQTGGTNSVAGGLIMLGYENTTLALSGGLLAADSCTVNPAYEGGVYLTGGTLIITNILWLRGNSEFPFWEGFNAGGQMIVSDISMDPQSSFSCGDGVITQSGTLTLANASLYAGSNTVQFGRVCLGDGGNTNSTLYMPSGASVVHFADSSSMTWSNDPVLIIANWSGSPLGGGAQQIIFGNSSAALTAAQLAQIQFQNPVGLAAGTYPAKILSSGEIVPVSSAPAHPNMALKPQPSGMQITLRGEAGRTYCIEVSTDMVNWVAWTNQTTSDGNISITDTDSKNCPARFYRAKLMP
ncbi:MAG TPA: hypothetical protein VG938_07520 [Verrucomicrobiae bacterium]|jgi:hypothetical protein|nr:hypothetical protein [Verrucomicrobiae bacterium]